MDLRASGAHKLIKVEPSLSGADTEKMETKVIIVEPSVSANVVLVNDILFHIFEKIVFDVLM